MEILVPTSNNYIHCLKPFAYLFNKYWITRPNVTVLCYDVVPRDLPSNFSVLQIGKQEDYTWSAGLLRGLKLIQAEIFVLMLEDYFLDQPVNIKLVNKLYEHLINTHAVVKIDLTNDRTKLQYKKYSAIPNGILSDYGSHYQTSIQAALWRKSFISKFLNPEEGPWEWEKRGTKRVIQARLQGEKLDILGTTAHPVHYVNAIGGEGNHPHRWAKSRFPKWLWNSLIERGLV